MKLFRFFSILLFTEFIFCFQTNYLKENYKNFFKKPINYQYFSNDIQLNSNLFPSVKGKEQYQFLFNLLQFFSKKIFLNYQINILSSKETFNSVELLWKLKGQTKILYPISIEGFSSYEKDSLGYLTEHNITFYIKTNPISQIYNESGTDTLLSYCLFQEDCLYKDDCFFIQQFKNCCKDDHYPHPWLKRPIKVLKE